MAQTERAEVAGLDADRVFEPALRALETQRKHLLDMERLSAEAEHGKERSVLYLKYFEEGLGSKTGMIMIEGHESRWLEIAFWRGYSFRQAFVSGYFSGKAETIK